MMETFKLEPSFVLREDEGIVFDSNKFVVQKINESGMKIIQLIKQEAKTKKELHTALAHFSARDIDAFLQKAVKAGFVIKKHAPSKR